MNEIFREKCEKLHDIEISELELKGNSSYLILIVLKMLKNGISNFDKSYETK
jgi:hypothetical protein